MELKISIARESDYIEVVIDYIFRSIPVHSHNLVAKWDFSGAYPFIMSQTTNETMLFRSISVQS